MYDALAIMYMKIKRIIDHFPILSFYQNPLIHLQWPKLGLYFHVTHTNSFLSHPIPLTITFISNFQR
jgi:hypothetical protein